MKCSVPGAYIQSLAHCARLIDCLVVLQFLEKWAYLAVSLMSRVCLSKYITPITGLDNRCVQAFAFVRFFSYSSALQHKLQLSPSLPKIFRNWEGLPSSDTGTFASFLRCLQLYRLVCQRQRYRFKTAAVACTRLYPC